MVALFKHLCKKCKKNRVLVSSKNKFPICYDCQKEELNKEIKSPKMKKLFDIPEEYYKENAFLRSIKINYLRFGNLSEKQIEYFKKTVEKMKNEGKQAGVSFIK